MRLFAATLCALGFFCLAPWLVLAQVHLPDAPLREAYDFHLAPPAKGTPPWHWRLLRGTLPRGIALESSGLLSGTPTSPGEFHFTAEATDSARKQVVQTSEFFIVVPSLLALAWTRAPYVTEEGAIAGELQVKNGADGSIDFTVFVVAVNTANTPFALAYQQASLGPGALRVPFGSSLPRDSYVVHADAVAEIADTHEIYRARLHSNLLTVPAARK